MAWVAVLDAPELGARVLGFAGPKAALASRGAGRRLAEAWDMDAVAGIARAGAWSACLPASASLHALLAPFARRALYPWTRKEAAGAAADNGELFNAVFTLLARVPAAAMELPQRPQPVGGEAEERGAAEAESMRRSPLIVASRCGLTSVAWLIGRTCGPEGGGLNEQDAMGCSALRYAIVNKDDRMCRCLLSFPGVTVELPDARGDSSLMQAVGVNAPMICRVLLERRADAGYVNRGQTALDLADALGYEGCSAVLREHGAPFGQRAGAGGAGAGGPCDAAGCAWSSEGSDSEIDEDLRESERVGWTRLLRGAGAGLGSARTWQASAAEARARAETQLELELDRLAKDEEGEGERLGQPRAKRQRWDMGGMFIKTRGGPTQRWLG